METIDIRKHEVSPMDSYLFDTNVWLLLYGPVANVNRKQQKLYSDLLQSILSRKATVFITSIVLSEYINRVLRMGFEQWKMEEQTYGDFKRDYRPTEHYAETLKDAIEQVKEILSCCEKRSDDFNALGVVNNVLYRMNSSCDYNDAYLLSCCEKNQLKLVSNDADFQNINSKVKVITTIA